MAIVCFVEKKSNLVISAETKINIPNYYKLNDVRLCGYAYIGGVSLVDDLHKSNKK